MAKSDSDLFYSSKLFQDFFKNTARSLVLKADAPRFTIVAVSDTYLKLTHKQREQLLGKGLFEVFPGSQSDLSEKNSVHSSFMRVIETKATDELPVFKYEIYVAESNLYTTQYWTNVNEALLDDEGNVAYLINTTTNITEQVLDQLAAKRQVEQAELNLRLATEAARIGTWYIDPHTKALKYNSMLAKIYGYEGQENMTYNQAINQVTEEFRASIIAAIEKAIATGADYEFTYQQRRFNDGKLIWLRSIGKITKDESGHQSLFSGVAIDITPQMEAQREVQESEERFRLMAEGTDVMIAIADETGSATFFNRAWTDVTGRTADELMKDGWADLMHPEDKERVLKIFTEAFALRKPWTWEFRMPDRKGKYRWLLARGIPRLRSDGSFAGYISSSVDITEIKEDEQRKSDFINMVSHELKTPLTSILSYVQIAQRNALKNNENFTADLMEKTRKQLGKMHKIINGFLNVSRLESGKMHINRDLFDLALLIRETEEESIVAITSHHVVFAPVEETWVTGDRDKIGQVINNFISNAVKYSPSASIIKVECVTVNQTAFVRVHDQGMGIRKEDIPKLFERYFRLVEHDKNHISGFGIGLYLCSEIITRHQGNIGAESEIGKGSTFWFSIHTSPAS